MMWTTKNIPDQSGKCVVITGANSGIGFETALALYKAGAEVILTGRDATAVNFALEKIRLINSPGTISAELLDLSSWKNISAFAERFSASHQKLNLLINNAGVMTPPESKTEEGYEMQFGVNFLGHYYLTGLLFPLLKNASGSRIITLSSGAYKYAQQVDYDNLFIEKEYDANREYAISKLANLQFSVGLQRRISKAGINMFSLAAHPGVTKTGIARHMPEAAYKAALDKFGELMPSWQGALSTLYAATSANISGGGYYGPDGEHELFGYPAAAEINEIAGNVQLADELWRYAEKSTGIIYPF